MNHSAREIQLFKICKNVVNRLESTVIFTREIRVRGNSSYNGEDYFRWLLYDHLSKNAQYFRMRVMNARRNSEI